MRQELEIKSLMLNILSKVGFCETLKLRCLLGIWVLNSEENSGLEISVQSQQHYDYI